MLAQQFTCAANIWRLFIKACIGCVVLFIVITDLFPLFLDVLTKLKYFDKH